MTDESSALAPASAFVNMIVLGFDHFAGTKKGKIVMRELDRIFSRWNAISDIGKNGKVEANGLVTRTTLVQILKKYNHSPLPDP